MGHRLRLAIVLALVVLLLGCTVEAPPPPTPCALTCDAWARLGCEEGEPTPERGVTCVDLCVDTEAYERLPHYCIQTAPSCAIARECR